MPVYEYECPKCGRFEAWQKMSDEPLKKNPDCNCPDCPNCAKRILSPCTSHFVGSGFYQNDYKSSNKGNKTDE